MLGLVGIIGKRVGEVHKSHFL